MHDTIVGCRSCGDASLSPVLSLGDMPLADAFPGPDDLPRPDATYPLNVAVCGACALVQIKETVPPEVLFADDYPYYSSFSDELVAHACANAVSLIDARGLGAVSLVVELASNDGYMLRHFLERGVPVLGYEPADGPATAAEQLGIETVRRFFGRTEGDRLARRGTRADVIIANNVLAHVADLNGFVAGIAAALQDDGVAVIEVPYVRDLIERREFDTIYHEHLCYFSVSSLVPLLRRHGLSLNTVEHLSIHGGSLRLFVEASERVDGSVRRALDGERAAGMTEPTFYESFGRGVDETRHALMRLLRDLKDRGARIAAYGAAAKGTTLLNATGIGPDLIDYVVDRNVHKQGRYMPGVRVPIHDTSRLTEDRPDYVLMLAWNFRDEILAQQHEYLSDGGRFIVPIPTPTIVPAGADRTDRLAEASSVSGDWA